MAGLEVEGAIDGGDIVLILAAALEEETGLDVMAADELGEVFFDVDDAVEVVELAGGGVETVEAGDGEGGEVVGDAVDGGGYVAGAFAGGVGGEGWVRSVAVLTDDVTGGGELEGVDGGGVDDAGVLNFVAFAGDVAIEEDEACEVLELIEGVGKVVEGDLVFGGEVIVQLKDVLVGVGGGGGGEDEVATGTDEVGDGVVLDQRRHAAVDAVSGNDTAGKRGVRCDVARLSGGGEAGEITATLGEGGDDPGIDGSLAQALVFLAEEEEELGFVGIELLGDEDGTAEIPAEVVEAKFLLLDGVEGTGVEGVVADEFVGAAVEGAGAGFEGEVNDGAGVLAVFGAVVGGEDFELGDGVGVDVDEVVAAAAVVFIVDAVNVPGEGVGAAAVGRLAAGVGAEAAGEVETAGVVGGDAGDEGEELNVVAAVELELGSLGAGDDAPDFAAGGFDGGGVGTDGDAVGNGTDFELDIGGDLGVHFDADVLADILFKSGGGGFDVVEADGDAGDGVGSAFVDGGFAFKAGGGAADRYLGAADGEAGGVADNAGDLLGRGLGEGEANGEEKAGNERR